MPTSEELRAQLAMTELEEQLVAEKEAGATREELRPLKAELREARERFRTNYRSPSTAVGDGTAEPEAIESRGGK